MPLNIHAEALEYLRKESLDIYNRIHSIQEDIAFVESVREAYPTLTFLPNLRCGAWYTNPAHSSNEPAYFKSTDGHYNNWGFNLRRPNLHLIAVASRRDGLILVDSTRAGKRIPDALSKTVPIWCAVINRAIRLRHSHRQSEAISDQTNWMWDSALYTPPGVISPQEHVQIERRLDEWAEELAASSYTLPDIPCPLRPLWITPATRTFPSVTLRSASLSSPLDYSVTPMYIPIICVSASRQVQEGIERRSQGFSYVQGSGDDHELWGMGLTPDLFWKHGSTLLDASRHDLEGIVRRIVTEDSTSSSRGSDWKNPPSRIAKVDGRILVCSIDDLPVDLSPSSALPHDDIPSDHDTAFLIISPPSLSSQPTSNSAPLTEPTTNAHPTSTSRCSTPLQPQILHLYLDSGKKGQHTFLHSVLPRSLNFVSSHLAQKRRQQGEEEGVDRGRNVCIACESGKDASVGVAVAALQILFDDEGRYRSAEADGLVGGCVGTAATKQSIRRRLEWTIASRPQANPSRTTLKRVNDFLLSPQSRMS